VEEFGLDLCEKFGTAECVGIKYIEYNIPVGTASKVGIFYESVFDATTQVIDDLCLVACGSIDNQGRAQQYMIFRETDDENSKDVQYDGHHVAIYIGSSEEDFEVAFERCVQAGIVWVNPRFKDRATTLETAKEWNQFRLKDIIDIDTGMVLFQLEHEVRSIHHDAHPN
jgi:predicted enzyme related to lactoylglutathione lyase